MAKITAIEERRLLERWCNDHDLAARNQIVLQWHGLAVNEARRLYKRNSQLDLQELVNEGVIGLIIAVDRFKLGVGRFSTYAICWVRQRILQFVFRNALHVKVSTRSQRRAFSKFAATRRRLENTLSEVSLDDIATELDVRREDVDLIAAHSGHASYSLQAPLFANGGTQKHGDRLVAEGHSAESLVMDCELARAVRTALKVLTPRERTVVTQRFLRREKVPLRTLGAKLQVTNERVRQIQVVALQKLRAELARCGITEV